MGEYAKRLSDGEEVKIGTCEDMYYLRADQREQVAPLPGSVDVNGRYAIGSRFRFPFPDEDRVRPGDFEPYDRGETVPAEGRFGGEHAEHGYLRLDGRGYALRIPCPVHVGPLEGLFGAPRFVVELVQQKLLEDGRLVPVLRCRACSGLWRLEDPEEIEQLAQAFDGFGLGFGHPSRVIAERIRAGALLKLVTP